MVPASKRSWKTFTGQIARSVCAYTLSNIWCNTPVVNLSMLLSEHLFSYMPYLFAEFYLLLTFNKKDRWTVNNSELLQTFSVLQIYYYIFSFNFYTKTDKLYAAYCLSTFYLTSDLNHKLYREDRIIKQLFTLWQHAIYVRHLAANTFIF